MKTCAPTTLAILLLSSLAGFFIPQTAHAFAEDICFRYVDPQAQAGDVIPHAFNCWNVECTDSVKPENTPAGCAIKGVVRYLNATVVDGPSGLYGRNMVHFDTVYLFGRMLGLSADDAFDAAAYSQATDLVGGYTHTDQYGKALAATDNLQGITRLNIDTAGYSYHFVPWLRSEGGKLKQALVYDPAYQKHGKTTPYLDSEVLINHLRLWAFGGRDTLCSFGITQDITNPAAGCFTEQDGKKIYVSIPLLALGQDTRRSNYFTLASQNIRPTNANPCGGSGEEPCAYDPDYAKTIHGSAKSLGIYLHVMGDRLSHSYCTDPAFITKGWNRKQPKPDDMASEPDYSVWFRDSCGTINHMAKHYPETGHEPLPQQTVLALTYGYREIQAWIEAGKYFASHPEQKPATPRRGFPQLGQTSQIVKRVGQALTLADAGERNQALCKLALEGYGITPWHDGSTDCKYPPHK